jgi:adenylate kinase
MCFPKPPKPEQWRTVVILVGAPGSGKGTQAERMTAAYKLPQLSTGDMLRDAIANGSDVGKEAKKFMDKGALVPDEVVIGIIRQRITEMDCGWGFILDGFPRNVAQAEALDAMLAENDEKVSQVIVIDTPDSVLEERVCGRWIHKASGRSYHLKFNPPKTTSPKPLDDVTGEPLEQRSDDTAATLQKRLHTYHSQTEPVIEHYTAKKCVGTVNGNQAVDKVWEDIQSLVSSL